jgi:hypothetical protein
MQGREILGSQYSCEFLKDDVLELVGLLVLCQVCDRKIK